MMNSLLLASVLLTQPTAVIPEGKIALMEPVVSQEIFTAEGPRLDAFDGAERVAKRMENEVKRWKGWKVRFAKYQTTLEEQRQQFGPRGSMIGFADLAKLDAIAAKTGSRYVAFYSLKEFTGARTSGFGARTTGRATLDLTIFDSDSDRYIWQQSQTETSTRTGTRTGMQPRMDQALLNCLRIAMEPFAVKGLRKEIVVQ